MKYILSILTLTFLVACSTTPEIIPDNTSDNVVMMQLKDHIAQPGPTEMSYGWLFWYGPVALLGLMWGYRNLIKKPINCLEEEPQSTTISTEVKQVSVETEESK
jgi:hypothetical protein